jgi:DNA-binding MarR family transcriptional regulator
MSSMDPAVIRELEAQMGVVARRVRRVVAERAAAIDPALGAIAYSVLDHLAAQGPSRQSDLVSALSSEKGAVSRAVQQLVDLGLALREEDPRDGRACVVTLSAEGRRRLDALVRRRRSAYAEKLAGWSPEELEELVRLLGRYNESLER